MPRTLSPVPLTAIVCLAEVFSMTGTAVVPALATVLKQTWGLNNTEAGWILGTYWVGYVIAVPVLSGLTDRVAPRIVYGVSLAIGVFGCLGFAYFAQGLWTAILFHTLMGVGLAGTYMPGLKILSDRLIGTTQSRGTAFYTSTFGIGLSLSFYVSGQVEAAFGWQTAFMIGACGPVISLLLVILFIDRDDPKNFQAPDTHLLDFRPVFRCRPAMGYVWAYSVHNFELFVFRSWMVAFFTFAVAASAGGGFGMQAATLAAIITLFGQPASILGNEGALRFGRHRWITGVMFLAACTAAILGFLAAVPFWILFAVCCFYMYLINSDSAAITSGMVGVAPEGYRGATMAMHSCLGFAGAAAGPPMFGAVLDLAGGESQVMSWGLGFLSVAVLCLLGPLALWWSRQSPKT
ncbi:MAG: MFS transporter [Rhodospirillaceae bacterium]|jgi:MFS family permease